MSKQLTGPSISKDHPVSIICEKIGASSCDGLLELLPFISLALVAYIILKCISYAICQKFLKYFVFSGTILSYISIAFHWASESTFFAHTGPIREYGRSFAPRFVYALGGLSLAISALYRLFGRTGYLKMNKRITNLSATMICSWSPTVLILLGRQGPFVALICMTGGTMQIPMFQSEKVTKHLFFPLPLIFQFGVSQSYSRNTRESRNLTYLYSVLLTPFRLFNGVFLQFVYFI
jgi:phosphatidylinositol glycan class O